MGIRVHCPACGHKMNLKSFLAGKRGVCPKCQGRFDIPTKEEADKQKQGPPGGGAETTVETAEMSAPHQGASPGQPAPQQPPAPRPPSTAAKPAKPAAVPAPPSAPSQPAQSAPPVAPSPTAESPSPVSAPAPQSPAPQSPAAQSSTPQSPPPNPVAESPQAPGPQAAGPQARAAPGPASVGPSAPNESPGPQPVRVVAARPAGADPFGEAPDASWYVRPPSGGQFGPAKSHLMRRWFDEGRVTSDSLVWRDGWPDWKRADGVFPQLSGGRAQPAPGASQAGGAFDVLGPSAPTGYGGRPLTYRRKSSAGRMVAITVLALALVTLAPLLVWVLYNNM